MTPLYRYKSLFIAVALAGIFSIGTILLIFPARHEAGSSSLKQATPSAFPEVAGKLDGLHKQHFAQAEVSPTDPDSLAAKALAAIRNPNPDPHLLSSGQRPQQRPEAISKDLLPKQPQLSASQKQALSRLRWGKGKDFEFTADGDDATLRLLHSRNLAEAKSLPAGDHETSADLTIRFFEENADLLLLDDPGSELVLSKSDPDPLGGEIVRFDQYHQGLRVWPGSMAANVDENGVLKTVTGAYFPSPQEVPIIPALDAETAVAAAYAHYGLDLRENSVEAELLVLASKDEEPELAYRVFVEPAHHVAFISATSGLFLQEVPDRCAGVQQGSGVDLLGYTRSLNVYYEPSDSAYYLLDASKPMFNESAETLQESGLIMIWNGVTEFPSYSLSLNSGYDPEGVGAAYNLGKAYDYWKNQFGLDSYDNQGTSIFAFVRVPDIDRSTGLPTGQPLDNAFWSRELSMFGFGTARKFTAASDVVGHEYMHAVTQHSADLVYSNDSGALNESFSDIFGEAFERYVYGANDWLLGSVFSEPFRNMKNPGSIMTAYGIPYPSRMSEYILTTDDHGGVHLNSSIPNHAFYLLASSMGFDDAVQVFYRALTTKLNAGSDFYDLRDACVLSAQELPGMDASDVSAVRAAFDAVEIFSRSALPAPEDLTPPSGPDSYLFVEEATNGYYYLWRREAAFGDGSSTVAISNTPVDPWTRFSVDGSGEGAVYITYDNDLAFVSTDGNEFEALGYPDSFNSVAVSADASTFACVLLDPITGVGESRLFFGDLETGTTHEVDLYLPVIDGPQTYQITTVDEIDLSPDGQSLLFDGYVKTTLGDGTTFETWTLFALDLTTEAIYTLYIPDDRDMAIGNPSFSRTSGARFVFEMVYQGDAAAIAVDLNSGLFDVVYAVPDFLYSLYPRYSAADDFIVLTEDFYDLWSLSYKPSVIKIPLASDHVTPNGVATDLRDYAMFGASYRRGNFMGAPVLSVTALTPSVIGGETGSFRISRVSGDQSIRVPITFTMTGTARPNDDYQAVEPQAQLSAGVNYVDIPVPVWMQPGESSKSLTLSISSEFNYRVSDSGKSSSMLLVAPQSTYDSWASQNGIGSRSQDDDGDGIKNLIEYAFGLNPLAHNDRFSSQRIVQSGLSKFFEIEIDRNQVRPGVSWMLERSPDLNSWQSAGTAILQDTPEKLILRDSKPLEINENRYLRLRFSEN